MSPYEPSVNIWTRIFIHITYIFSFLAHCSSVIGLAFIEAWLLPTYHEFGNHNRSEDEAHALAAFILFIFVIIGHGTFLWLEMWNYIFQCCGSENFPESHWGVALIKLIIDAVFLHRFLKWHGHFEVNGDSRSATYCTLAIFLLAFDIAWMFCSWILPFARLVLSISEQKCEASADCEGLPI